MNRRRCGKCKREVATAADVDAYFAAPPAKAREVGAGLCWGPNGMVCTAVSEGRDPAQPLTRKR